MRVMPAGAGFLGLPAPYCDYETATVVVVPVAFERSVSFGTGADRGPGRILEASHQVELFDEDRGLHPYRQLGGVATLPPLDLPPDADGAAVAVAVEAVVARLLADGKRVVTLGGEHTSIVGAIAAHARHHGPLDLLQLDAHSDLRETYEGDPWSHACAMTRALPHVRRLVQVAIRAFEPDEESARADPRVTTLFARPLLAQARRDPDGWTRPVVDRLADPVYVTFDCDALDCALMPATGTPEPGGLGWADALDLLDAVGAGRRVVGFDVSELAPIPGLHHPEFVIARLVYKMMAAAWLPTGSDRDETGCR